jgi:hypothetical protein
MYKDFSENMNSEVFLIFINAKGSDIKRHSITLAILNGYKNQ